jgi:hypothetical protein
VPDLADHTDFGPLSVAGGSLTRTYTIINSGTEVLMLTGGPRVVVEGPDAGDFVVTVPPPASVAAASSATFQVTFNPSAVGLRTATLSIASDDSDEAPFDFAIQGTGLTIYDAWAAGYGVSDDPAALGANGLANLLNFAFGVDPVAGGNGPLQYGGTFAGSGTITATGQPITRFEPTTFSVDFRALFVRRTDYVMAGLTYTPQFSATLGIWQDSGAEPVVLADDGTHQIVSVPYPFFIAGKKAQFFRISVDLAP